MKNLTLRFIPYAEIEKLESQKMIKKLLDFTIDNRIIVLQGRLKPEDEAILIQSTMALVGKVKGFKGVELATIQPRANQAFFKKVKLGIAKALAGDRDSLTVIGPASVIKEIKRDPSKIELLLKK